MDLVPTGIDNFKHLNLKFEQGEGRGGKHPVCPTESVFSAFGFASFILISVQTVVNIINCKLLSFLPGPHF